MKAMALLAFIFLFTVVLSLAFPAQAQMETSVLLPIRAQIIGYAEAKQTCCYDHKDNGWCWRMISHLWTENLAVYDDRSEPVPAEARRREV